MVDTKSGSHTTDSAACDVEEVCRRFEAELHQGQQADIHQYLKGWEEPERSRLLCELIGIEVQSRRAAGLPVQIQDFMEMFPGDAAAVREAFETQRDAQTVLPTVLLEQLKTESRLQHLRFLAEGGLGQVFVAEDATLRRDAAVKLIREDLTGDSESCEQFRVEAEVTGRLDHPGIPLVYAIGQTSQGRLFYAMQYIRGARLDKLIRKHHKEFVHVQGSQWFGLKRLRLSSSPKGSATDSGSHRSHDAPPTDSSTTSPLDLRELLEIFISVCHTIGYAHRRGILHRDIKPSNVIHGKFGETVVIDWGLALPIARQGVFKDVAEQTISPRSGKNSRQSIGCVGTPAFMSPEQARGDVPLTPASDIFSLGTLLYYMLTGTPPYQGQSAHEVRKLAMEAEFTHPSSLAPHVPASLEAICLKAMRPPISERYRTTHDIVADIREYLADRPVSAHPESSYRRLSRWMRHHTQTVLVTMLGIAVLALTVGLVSMWKSWALLREQRTSQAQSDWAANEKTLREKSLVMAADLAARTLANKIDIVYRTLELFSREQTLQTNLEAWNQSGEQENERLIQTWLDGIVSAEPPSMRFRSWFVLGLDGTFLARTPEFSNGTRSASIGKVFAFRDYFHGLGQDLPPDAPAPPPLDAPHNSAAIFSILDKQMTVYFTVPVRNAAEERIGALVVCVACREFSDLDLQQSSDQQLLLIEGRGYPMSEMEWSDQLGRVIVQGTPQWSTGVLLHHQSEQYRADFGNLPRVDKEVLRDMTADDAVSPAATSDQRGTARLFTQGIYADPLQPDTQGQWLAAFCPVYVDTRADAEVAKTGWYVIVQQKLVNPTTAGGGDL